VHQANIEYVYQQKEATATYFNHVRTIELNLVDESCPSYFSNNDVTVSELHALLKITEN
jgi:hypothetical protein